MPKARFQVDVCLFRKFVIAPHTRYDPCGDFTASGSSPSEPSNKPFAGIAQVETHLYPLATDSSHSTVHRPSATNRVVSWPLCLRRK